MSAPLRFIFGLVVGWLVLRGTMVAMAPPSAAAPAPPLPPVTPSRFATLDLLASATPPPPAPLPAMPSPPTIAYSAAPQIIVRPLVTGYAPWPRAAMPRPASSSPPARLAAIDYDLTDADRAPVAARGPVRLAAAAIPVVATSAAPQGFDRWTLSSWALVRQTVTGTSPGQPGLAGLGTLGGSQGGARLLYRIDRRLAVSARATTSLGGIARGEAALGLRYQPLPRLPVALTVERRHPIGRFANTRAAFAALAEAGLYDRPIAAGFRLDGYAQAGVVGIRNPLWFVDGAASLTRPLFGQISGGVGIWGAAQADLHRLDIGPRLTLHARRGMRVHLDYRYKLLGNANPPSGATVTIAGDF